MENYVGKNCPFCKTPITEEDAVKVCPACGIPHHEGCWQENGGCTTFGCSEQHYEEQHTNPTDVCTNCGAPLGDGQLFCPKCGTAKAAAPKANVCSKCGNELAENQAFCPNCGHRAGLVIEENVHSAIDQFNAGITQQNQKKKPPLALIIGIAAAVIVLLIVLFSGTSVDAIVLSESSVDVSVGNSVYVSYTITPADASDVKVTWKSSNTSVATVSNGTIVGKNDGTCTITATAGGKSDTVVVTVTSGPDLIDIYNQYCSSTWADYGSDGSYLSIDTNPYDWDDEGVAYPAAYEAIKKVNETNSEEMSKVTGALNLPGMPGMF